MTQILLIAAVAYGVLVGALYLFQRSLMYQPGTVLPSPGETLLPDAQVRRVESAPGLGLTSWYVPPQGDAPVIVYFQGNAATIADRDYKVRPWASAGYGVWLTGYRGFGGNPGAPSEDGLYADAAAVLETLAGEGIPPRRIVLYGESLGTGVATEMALRLAEKGTPVLGLILEAPFTAMGAAAQDHYPYVPAKWLVRDRYDSIGKIARISAPLLVIHGDRDRVVKQAHGKRLFAAALEPKTAYWPEGAAHNDLYDHGTGVVVQEFLDRLRES